MNPNNRIRFVPTILAIALALIVPAFAQEAPAPGVDLASPDNETPQLWFVEFAGAPSAAGGTKSAAKAERDAFGEAAKTAGIKYAQRYAFDTLWNGISVSITPGDLGRLSRLPQVANIFPVDTYQLPELPEDNIPQLATAIAMTGANVVQAAGITGAGVRVGIIDTGIDIDHPAFGGSGTNGTTAFPTPRIPYGYDFVGDAYTGPGTTPMPDANPDDVAGHGTHVAGIVGANGLVTGVAPGVTFGAYRVFGNTGSTSADIMIAAMERALADGMQVVNMSIGSSFTWPQYPTATAADRLVNLGVVVVCSIGNSGANGLYSAGSPGLGKDVIGVASFDNTHNALPVFTVSPDAAINGYSAATGAPLPPASGTFPMARANLNGTPLVAGGLTGKVALISRGTFSFYSKALNAKNAGAIAVVIYNNAAGRISATVAGTPAITIPTVTISQAEGLLINSRLTAGPVDLTWTSSVASFASATGNRISSFSSYGLSPDLALKPDLGAPGGNIFSTFPLEKGGYASLSGTSMSSPHVAGIVALYLQAYPGTSALAMNRILQNTAQPKGWWANPAAGLDNVHRQGAGMVAIDRAMIATGGVSPGKLSLGESETGAATRTLTVENNAATATTYALSHVAALSTGANTFTPSFSTSNATATFSSASVTVPAGGRATVDVTISPATAPDKGMYGGYVVLTPQSGGETLRVPYAGFIGDYQSIQVLTPTANGFPWLAQLVGPSYFNRPTGGTYTMMGTDVAYILVHLDHPSRSLKVEIFNATTGAPVHPVFYTAFKEDYLPRNSTATGFYAFAWDGTRQHNNGKGNDNVKVLPNGSYILKMSVLKALGDAANPAHWETWTSSVVTVARP